MASSNEALIKSGNKPSFVVPFRIIIHPLGTSFLKENNLAVVVNAITTSLVRLLENRFDSLGDFKYMQIAVPNCSLTLPAYIQSVTLWINSLAINAYLVSGLEASPFPVIS